MRTFRAANTVRSLNAVPVTPYSPTPLPPPLFRLFLRSSFRCRETLDKEVHFTESVHSRFFAQIFCCWPFCERSNDSRGALSGNPKTDVALLVVLYQRFGGIYCVCLQSRREEIAALNFFEMWHISTRSDEVRLRIHWQYCWPYSRHTCTGRQGT